jgi:hypothetical protein
VPILSSTLNDIRSDNIDVGMMQHERNLLIEAIRQREIIDPSEIFVFLEAISRSVHARPPIAKADSLRTA